MWKITDKNTGRSRDSVLGTRWYCVVRRIAQEKGRGPVYVTAYRYKYSYYLLLYSCLKLLLNVFHDISLHTTYCTCTSYIAHICTLNPYSNPMNTYNDILDSVL